MVASRLVELPRSIHLGWLLPPGSWHFGQPGGRTLSGASPWLSVPLYTQASSLENELRRSQSTPHLVPAGVSGHIYMSTPSLLDPQNHGGHERHPLQLCRVGACVQIWLHLIQCNQPCVFFPIRVFVSLVEAALQPLIPQKSESPDHQARPPAGCTLHCPWGGVAIPGALASGQLSTPSPAPGEQPAPLPCPHPGSEPRSPLPSHTQACSGK